MKKYILLSIALLTGGTSLIGMKRKHSEDTLSTAHKQTRECGICWDDKETNQFTTLSCCGHNTSCTECLVDLIDTSLQEKTITRINCPSRTECKQPMSQPDIRTITQAHPEVYERFCNVAIDKYLTQDEKHAKHCPTPDCAYSFINDTGLKQAFECPQCTQAYCSNCLVQHAQTMTCEQAKRERELTENADLANQATQKWIADNTKECPACHKSIQKNGGCNHMTCKQCLHEFCWTCGATFRTTRCNTNYCVTTGQVPINAQPLNDINMQEMREAEEELRREVLLRRRGLLQNIVTTALTNIPLEFRRQFNQLLQGLYEPQQEIIRQQLDMRQQDNAVRLMLQLMQDQPLHQEINRLRNRRIQLPLPQQRTIEARLNVIGQQLFERLLEPQDIIRGQNPEILLTQLDINSAQHQQIARQLQNLDRSIDAQELAHQERVREEGNEQRRQTRLRLRQNYLERRAPLDQEFNQLFGQPQPVQQQGMQQQPQFQQLDLEHQQMLQLHQQILRQQQQGMQQQLPQVQQGMLLQPQPQPIQPYPAFPPVQQPWMQQQPQQPPVQMQMQMQMQQQPQQMLPNNTNIQNINSVVQPQTGTQENVQNLDALFDEWLS